MSRVAALAAFSASILALTALPPSGAAQEVPPEGAQPEAGTRTEGIERITIQARKKEESLQEAPLSVSALTGADLERQSVEDLVDLQYTLPNVTLSQSQATGSTAFIAIRGITSSEFTPSVDSGVSLYLDGIWTSRLVGAISDTLDLERVEVLRGPQGTLFGRNTTGGALALYSRRPDGTNNGRLSFGLGSDGRYESRGAIGFPIVGEELSGRMAWALRSTDHFSTSAATGNEFEDQHVMQFKGSLRWQPSEAFDLNFIADRRKARDGYTNAKLHVVDRQETFPNLLAAVDAALGRPHVPPETYARGNPRRTHNDGTASAYQGLLFGERQDDDLWGFVLDANLDLSDRLRFRSLSGHRRLKARRSGDNDGFPFDLFSSADKFGNKAFHQEFQLQGEDGDRLSWTAGFFAYYEESFNDAYQPVFTDVADLTFPGSCPAPGIPASALALACLINAASFNTQDVVNYSYAPYFEADFDLTDRLVLTAGVRYTAERRETKYRRTALVDGVYAGLTPNPTSAAFLFAGDCLLGENVGTPNAAGQFPDYVNGVGGCRRETLAIRAGFWSWNAMLAYRWTDSLMTFFRVARAQRSGNNPSRPLNQPDLVPTDPESLIQYELGMKSDWLQNRLRLNASVFHGNFSDIITNQLQSSAGGGIASIGLNSGRSYIQGAEIELNTADLGLPGLELGLSGGLLNVRSVHDTRLTSFGAVDYRDLARTGAAPRWEYSISAAYTLPTIGAGRLSGDLTLRLDWSQQGRTDSFDTIVRGSGPSAGLECTSVNTGGLSLLLLGTPAIPCTDPRAKRSGKTGIANFGLLNMQVEYEMPAIRSKLTFWGRNILDREYETGWIDFGNIGVIVSYEGAPREVGLTFTHYWGE